MIHDESSAVFRTSDYGAAAFLDAKGLSFSCLERAGNQIVFCFESTPQLIAAIEAYLSNSPVACKDYFRALRKAKTIIQETIHNNNAYSRRFV